ncbi:MAG: DUF1949 domain-containing protein [Spirochaetales bacterium]|nr:DUF1949 domain-containing protein [Spirochaetales bacterium]
MRVSYADQGAVRHLLEQAGATLTWQDHAETVELEFVIAAAAEAELRQTLMDATQGRALWIKTQGSRGDGLF